MDWSAAGVVLVAARAVHFTATAMTVGSIIFDVCIAGPVLQQHHSGTPNPFRHRTRLTMWIGLALAVISGAFWLLLETASMSGMPLGAALTGDMLSIVVNETQFGQMMTIRLGLAICVAVCLIYDRAATARWLGLAAAVGLAASIAWTGHAGAAVGATGNLHLAADALHAVAAAGWIGGLVSLISFLAVAEIRCDLSLVGNVVARFSALGMVAVAILLLTGLINAAMLVGSLHGLVASEYGRLLTLKVAVFAVMLAFASINRFRLTPRLARTENGNAPLALRRLIRNSAIEATLGVGILVIVGVLGTLHPAVHMVELAGAR